MVVPVHQAAKISAGKVPNIDMIVVSLSQSFVSVTRVHYAFDDFDNTECSADLFYRNTDIWTMGDVCPAPKIWVPYTPPDYSTYKHQSLPSYVRGKRASNGKECDRNTDQMSGCATIIYQYLAPFLMACSRLALLPVRSDRKSCSRKR